MVSTAAPLAQIEYRLIYLSGLPRPMPTADLLALCAPLGQVVDVHIERDPQTGAQWGFGFVEFVEADEAARAARALHGKRYRGDVLTARQVRRRHPPEEPLANLSH